MNQIKMNQIALSYIMNRGIEISKKLKKVFLQDVIESDDMHSGPELLYIHNLALYYSLLAINNNLVNENEATRRAFMENIERFQHKFFDIIDQISDFEPPATEETDALSNN